MDSFVLPIQNTQSIRFDTAGPSKGRHLQWHAGALGYETAPPHSFRPPHTSSVTRTRTNNTLRTHIYTNNIQGEHTPPSRGGLHETGGTHTCTREPHPKHTRVTLLTVGLGTHGVDQKLTKR